MDLTRTIIPKSDQKNADNFLAGPQTFTVTDEIEYADEQQPAGLVLDGDTAHPYKPCKSMRRVLDVAWGKESYVGRRLTLYNDPAVRFGGQETGGIRISHLSHIRKTLRFNLTETKGKKRPFTVEPLPDAQAPRTPPADRPTPEQMRALGECFTEARITTGADKAGYIADVIGHPLSSWDDLSAADVEAVTVRLRTYSGAPADEPWAADAPEDGA
jgi:hypothetical protein